MANTTTASHRRIRALCEGAIMVALAQALSYLKLYTLPNGGSLTPAMFPILFFAVRWGLGSGLLAGFAYGLLQLMFDGAYAWGWQSMLLDYLVAFTPLGFAGLFKGKSWGIFPGTVLGCALRFGVHYLSGVTIYRIVVPTEGAGPRHLFQPRALLPGLQRQLYAAEHAACACHCGGAVCTAEEVLPRRRYSQGRESLILPSRPIRAGVFLPELPQSWTAGGHGLLLRGGA